MNKQITEQWKNLTEYIDNMETCDWCDDKGIHEHEYYTSPFDVEPYSFKLCNKCNEQVEREGYYDVAMCGACYREISYSNGMRINMRYDEEDCEMYCVECLQTEWLSEGMKLFKEGDFFNYSDLSEAGFNKHGSYFCRSKESYERVEEIFDELQETNLVIVNIDSSGMGLEHHISLYIKEREQ
ncbi:MAG: hypothetical protein GY853_16625 [PVC group bacterium]|nr:hypothetical protein [PVC group bacterium]